MFINLSGDHCTPLILYPDRKGMFVLGSAKTLYQNDKYGGWSKLLEHLERNSCLRTAWVNRYGQLKHFEYKLPSRRSDWQADEEPQSPPPKFVKERSPPPKFNVVECWAPCEINPEIARQAFVDAKQAVKELLEVPFFALCLFYVLGLPTGWGQDNSVYPDDPCAWNLKQLSHFGELIHLHVSKDPTNWIYFVMYLCLAGYVQHCSQGASSAVAASLEKSLVEYRARYGCFELNARMTKDNFSKIGDVFEAVLCILHRRMPEAVTLRSHIAKNGTEAALAGYVELDSPAAAKKICHSLGKLAKAAKKIAKQYGCKTEEQGFVLRGDLLADMCPAYRLPQSAIAQSAAVQEATTATGAGQSAIEQSAAGQAAIHQSAAGPSASNQSGEGQSAIDKSAAGQRAIDQSVAGQSAINQPAADQKAIDQSAAGQSATKQSGEIQSAIDKSAAGQGAINQMVAGQSAINQPAAKRKAIGESAAGGGAIDQSAASQSVHNDARENPTPPSDTQKLDWFGYPWDGVLRPARIRDGRFAQQRSKRNIRCDECQDWCTGNNVGGFVSNQMPLPHERETAWEQGWDARWYCVECWKKYWNLERDDEVLERLGYAGRDRRRRNDFILVTSDVDAVNGEEYMLITSETD